MIKTSESVLSGHPDKICDQVADYILTKQVQDDPSARAGIECLIKDDLLVIAGEVTTKANISYTKVARECLKYIGLDPFEFNILEKISSQSPDIALGVDKGGAGDQGIMYGYACNETDELMPLPIVLSRKLARKLDELNALYSEYFAKDGKCQISINYENDKPKSVMCIVVSMQTQKGVDRKVYEPFIYKVVHTVIPKNLLTNDTKILINPTGEFVKGGSYADSGLTGRKLQCDAYGGLALHGGGAWSGKDLSKVDRSASYYARYIAKNIVASKLASRCEIGISYAIGVIEPVSVSINTFGTGVLPDDRLLEIVKEVFAFKPNEIRRKINIHSFIELSTYGHVGVLTDRLPWEKVDKADEIDILSKKMG
jgi:S-adenosylmethionine synthetase